MARKKAPDRAREVARLFQASVLPLESPECVAERRSRVVARLSNSIVHAAERRRVERRWKALAYVTAAACVLLSGGFVFRGSDPASPVVRNAPVKASAAPRAQVRTLSGSVTVLRDENTIPVFRDGVALAMGDRITTESSATAAIDLANEIFIELSQTTRGELTSSRERPHRFRLERGRLEARVDSRPAPSPKLIIETPDVEVVVTGTIFEVEVSPAEGARAAETVVTVSQGSVLIRRDRRPVAVVATGQRWSSTPREKATAPLRPERTASTRKPTRALSKSWSGSLAEENLLFRAAVDARNRGDDDLALYRFGELLAKYPRSPLAHEASIEKLRALKRLGRTRDASSEASRYIAEHPDGPGSNEARKVLLNPKR